MARRYPDRSIFEGTKPLEMHCTSYPWKYDPAEVESKGDGKRLMGVDTLVGKRLAPETYSNILYEAKANPAEKPKLQILIAMSIGDLFHKQLVARLEALCPGQFQYFPIVLVHKEKSPPFENRDFCLINFLHLIDAVDVERSIPKKNYVGLDPVQRCVYWDKMVFKENPWPEGVTIGRNLYKRPSILFHPSLANHFRQDPAMEFWTDEELTALVLT